MAKTGQDGYQGAVERIKGLGGYLKGIKTTRCRPEPTEKTRTPSLLTTHNTLQCSPASFAVLAAATPLDVRQSQCNGGTTYCCNSVQDASSSGVTSLLGLLGLSLGSITGQVGLNCSPITALGVGSGASCTSQAACCTGDSFNGLINVGCTSINLSL
ncbi:fungal hydrophobin-domain-containing protein [Pisolithus orientalis]|uniref:fungal hydrophobin-domain-containing protein n=1 Tax=Pisolithus orientalis TaxID=936130 RepID=UPI0022258743|nr:fungal hydrophobin-domain-containing protein [Pisolithus orientalis]KAI6015318.1 fungal hydrophobin-domain-containing protein [Pisolithus orientalis]